MLTAIIRQLVLADNNLLDLSKMFKEISQRRFGNQRYLKTTSVRILYRDEKNQDILLLQIVL